MRTKLIPVALVFVMPLLLAWPFGTGALESQPEQDEAVESEPVEPLLFPVRLDDKYGYIDNTGTLVVVPQFDDAFAFCQGLARVRVGGKGPFGEGKWGYIDKTGKFVWGPA